MLSRNMKQNVVRKPLCKVCKDAGKVEIEYTSHFLRSLPDRNGKITITCPTLLAAECRYCHKQGHTIKFCSVITDNKKVEERSNRRQNEAKIEKKSIIKKFSFNEIALDSDSEDEIKVTEEYPAIVGSNLNKTEGKIMTGWAAITARTPLRRREERPVKPIKKPQFPVKSWAEWSESEDEGDDEYYDPVNFNTSNFKW